MQNSLFLIDFDEFDDDEIYKFLIMMRFINFTPILKVNTDLTILFFINLNKLQ